MTMQLENKTLYSVTDAAETLGLTGGRIRQILGEFNADNTLASKLNRDWVMTPQQLKRLKAKHREIYKKKYGRFPDEG